MIDGISLDQLRTFLAAVDEGSFSAAGRKLGRAQSVVSQTLANLEGQLGVRLFDRSARLPVLTEAGQALVGQARDVASSMDLFKAQARGLAGGLEPELAVAVDVMFPIQVLTHAITDFQATFPDTPLRLYVEVLGAVLQPVVDGRCSLAISGSVPFMPSQLTQERLVGVRLVMVAAASHPLATAPGPIAQTQLAQHIQLVLSDRSALSEGREFGVMSPKTWRLADLGAKHAFLLAGLGWGGMPIHAVEADLKSGALVQLDVQDMPADGLQIPMLAVHRTDDPPGPAGRWLIDRLKDTASQCPS